MNINYAINKGSKYLKSKSIPNSQLDAEILMANTINKNRNYVLLNSTKNPTFPPRSFPFFSVLKKAVKSLTLLACCIL